MGDRGSGKIQPYNICVGCGPLSVTVTTRIIIFIENWDPNLNIHVPLLVVWDHITNCVQCPSLCQECTDIFQEVVINRDWGIVHIQTQTYFKCICLLIHLGFSGNSRSHYWQGRMPPCRTEGPQQQHIEVDLLSPSKLYFSRLLNKGYSTWGYSLTEN